MTVQPFTIHVPDDKLAAIGEAVGRFDFGRLPDAGGWQHGAGLDFMKRVVDHWLARFDWRAVEARLNRLSHFNADVDGQAIHFLHHEAVGPAQRHRRAILLVHGWPGSFLEFERLIGPLTDPAAHGAPGAEAFDVVVPSLPGFAFSGRPGAPIGPREIARLFHKLMTETLGYERFVMQGGDWGAAISAWMAHDYPASLEGIHLNMVLVQSADVEPTNATERNWAERRDETFREERAYAQLQGTRPQTLAYAMSDSPVGVAAWILEKFGAWSDLSRDADGGPDLLGTYDADTLIANVMLYLVTDAFPTSTWIYRGRILEGSSSFPAGTRIEVPTGVAAFPDPVFEPPPRSLVDRTYSRLVHWSEMAKGGHFAALEQPEALIADLRGFVAKLS